MFRNNSKILIFTILIAYIMENKVFRIIFAGLMALAVIALVVFMIIHIRVGLDGVNSRLLLAAYILMIIWAGIRLYTTIKSLLNR